MSLHEEIKQTFIRTRYGKEKLATMPSILDDYTVKVQSHDDWFTVTSTYKKFATSGLLFSVDTSELLAYPVLNICQGLSDDQICLVDVILPALFDFLYKPPETLTYSTSVKDYAEFAALVAGIREQAKHFSHVVVHCRYADYYNCKFDVYCNRISFYVNDKAVASMNITGEPEFCCYVALNVDEFVNAMLQLRD